MPEMTEKYFQALVAEVANEDALSSSVLLNNVQTASKSIRVYTDLSKDASVQLEALGHQVAALAHALEQFSMVGTVGESGIEKVLEKVNDAIARLGEMLANAQPSERARNLGFS